MGEEIVIVWNSLLQYVVVKDNLAGKKKKKRGKLKFLVLLLGIFVDPDPNDPNEMWLLEVVTI